MQTINILIVNPNSSVSITELIKQSILARPGVSVTFLTGPPGCPPTIDNDFDGELSAKYCLPAIADLFSSSRIDAVLVCCYSGEHPLITGLKTLVVERKQDTQILGIFEASIAHALALTEPGETFGIITTGKQWEPLLSSAVFRYLGAQSSSRFAGVIGTGLGVLELDHDGDEERDKMVGAAIEMADRGVSVICLGCAGMSGQRQMLKHAVQAAHPDKKVYMVDGVTAGYYLLVGMVLDR